MWWTCIITAVVASLVATWFTRYRCKKRSKSIHIGQLFVDPKEPEDRGGVYVAFDTDPKEFEDGQVVTLTVKLVRK